jgi:hypothetical protein
MGRRQKRLAKAKAVVDQAFYTKSSRFAEVEDEHVSSSDSDEPDEIGFFRKPSASDFVRNEEQSLSKPGSSDKFKSRRFAWMLEEAKQESDEDSLAVSLAKLASSDKVKSRRQAWSLDEAKQESDEDSPVGSLAKPGKAAQLNKRSAEQPSAKASDQQRAASSSQKVTGVDIKTADDEETKAAPTSLELTELERFENLLPKNQKRKLTDVQRSNKDLLKKVQDAKRELDSTKSINACETLKLSDRLHRTERELSKYRKDFEDTQDRIEYCKLLILNKDANVALASRLHLLKQELTELSETNRARRAEAEAKLASDTLALSRYSGNTDKMSLDEIKNFMVGLSETIQQLSFALATCDYRPPNPNLCLVCGERKKNIVFLNCYHLAMCQQCGDKATVCCLCKMRVVKTLVVFT